MRNITGSNRLRFGPYEVDLRTRELWKHGTRLKLVGQPFDILEELIARPGELVTREELRLRLWPGETFVDFNHGLNAAVNKLREALSDSADDPRYIETLPRRGYRFISTVETGVPMNLAEPPKEPLEEADAPAAIDAESSAGTAITTVAAGPDVPSETVIPRIESARSRRWPGRVLLAALLLAGVAIFIHFPRKTVVYYPVPAGKLSRSVILTGKFRYEGPQLSPDGKRLAFMSNQSGTMEIWTCDPDGSHQSQLTTIGGAGSPRWSPDGKSIVFDSEIHDHGATLAISAEGGEPRFIATGTASNLVPSWSRDGESIYFASDRSGSWQVWKVSAQGGAPRQVTFHGGFAALESSNRDFVYYAKTRVESPEIWRVAVGGGEETLVSPVIHVGTWASWSITRQGIVFVDSSVQAAPMITLFDLKERRLKQLTVLDRFPFWFSVSEDGKTAFYDRALPEESSIIKVEDFQ